MNTKLIDLHLHTSSSDGKLNTSQVIEEAEKGNIIQDENGPMYKTVSVSV